jgi:hypothetical protein
MDREALLPSILFEVEQSCAAGRGSRPGYDFQSTIALILAEGAHYFGGKPWLPECGWRKGTKGQCYKNAAKITLRDPARFIYCEGFSLIAYPDSWIEHAWAEDSDGAVVDPMLLTEPVEYFGLRLNCDFICKVLSTEGQYGILGALEPVKGLL